MKAGEDTKEVDKGITNKWRWMWINKIGSNGKPFRSWCQKLSEAGACFCTLCTRRLIYATKDKKVLSWHESDSSHKAAVRAIQYTSHLLGATAMADLLPSMTDRVTDLKICVCLSVAEHDLTFTMAEHIVSLAKKLAKDKIALTHMSLSRQHASYLITYGISPEFKKSLSEKLKNGIFSLNIDEATNIHNDRIMNILVRFL